MVSRILVFSRGIFGYIGFWVGKFLVGLGFLVKKLKLFLGFFLKS